MRALAPTHPWAQRPDGVTPTELAGTPLVMREQGSGDQRGTRARWLAHLGLTPTVAMDELLDQVHAVGVGVHDSHFLPPDTPYPIGIEGAGVVIDSDVPGHYPGDRIAFVSAMQATGGTWAEYAVVEARSLILPVPAVLGLIEATALPVAGNTTMRALAALQHLPHGAHVFVAGGSGAIGTLTVQLAQRCGWRLVASASERNQRLPALTRRRTDPWWPDAVRQWAAGGVDAAVAIQPGTTEQSMGVVANGGYVVGVSGDAVTPERGARRGTVPHDVAVHEDLVRLLDEVADGRIQAQAAVQPPSVGMTAPLTLTASSEQSQTTSADTSCGVAVR